MIGCLQDLVSQILEGAQDSKKNFAHLFGQFYSDRSQLVKAYLAMAAHLLHLEPLPLHPEQFPNGTVLLETILGIPEPSQLAQLGVLWMVLGSCLKDEVLQRAGLKIAIWHAHLLDSQGRPHLSLWSCAHTFSTSKLSLWSYALFRAAHLLSGHHQFLLLANHFQGTSAFPCKLLTFLSPQEIQQNFRPLTEEVTVGMIKFSNSDMSLMAHLSGSNSGLFSLHKKEVALVNGGPQIGSYDDLNQFGIHRCWAPKGHSFQDVIWEKTAYHCRLKGWTQLAKTPFWLHLDARSQAGQTTFEVTFQEKEIQQPLSILLFLKSPKLILEGKRYLEPYSLERYEGKAVPIELQGSEERMSLHPDPSLQMKVIPLAGGDHFWGAHFLVAFPVSPELNKFVVNIK